MKNKLLVLLVLFLGLGICHLALANDINDKPLLKGEIVYDGRGGWDKFWGIVPADKSSWPLLSYDPYNSFAFVIFYSKDDLKHFAPTSIEKNIIVLNIPSYESGRASVNLSKLKVFNEFFNEVRSLSRYDLVDKQDDIISNITKTHDLYSAEFKKYLSTLFEVYDKDKLDFEYYYDLNNQVLRLDIIGPMLYKSFSATQYSFPNTFQDNAFKRADPNGRSSYIEVKLPVKQAKQLMAGTTGNRSSVEVIYRYLIEPMPGIRKEECGIVGICGWMPSFNIRQIRIILKDKNDTEVINYTLDNITEKTVDCTPSFAEKYRVNTY